MHNKLRDKSYTPPKKKEKDGGNACRYQLFFLSLAP